MSGVTGLLHRAVAHPRVYDACQVAAGAGVIRRRLARAVAGVRGSAATVVDIGGGTGAGRHLWRADARYACLDIDPEKLDGYLAKTPGGLAIRGDAIALPLADACVDVVLCTQVTHHLTDPQLDAMLAEAARVLRPAGSLLLVDAVWRARRWPGRLLWRYDRGSFPRTSDTLHAALTRHFDITHWEQFAVWHAYVLAVARPTRRT